MPRRPELLTDTRPQAPIAIGSGRATGIVVEIVGPPGCGKSSLARALEELEPRFVASERQTLKDVRRLPFRLIHTPTLASAVFRQLRLRHRFAIQEFRDTVYVDTWHRVLSRQARRSGSIVLADQGPVFKLARLRAFDLAGIDDAPFERWWASGCERWSRVVRLIVYLDAPDAVLLERVRAREKHHPLKKTDAAASEAYLASYRNGLESVIAALRRTGRTRLIRLDAGDRSVSEIAAELLPVLLGQSPVEEDAHASGAGGACR